MQDQNNIYYRITINDNQESTNQATMEAAQGIFRIDKPIDENLQRQFSGFINWRIYKHPGEPVYLVINSPGGHVTDGMALYDTIESAKSMGCDVYTIGIGMAASMGAFLLAAGSKGKRFAAPSCSILLHQPLGGVSGQATDMLIHVENIVKMKGILLKILSENTGQSIEKLGPKMERDYIMNAEQALKEGIIDGIDYEAKIIQGR